MRFRKVSVVSIIIAALCLTLRLPAQTPDQAAIAQALAQAQAGQLGAGGNAPATAPQQPVVNTLGAPAAQTAPAAQGVPAASAPQAPALSSIEAMFAGMAAEIGDSPQELFQFGYSLFEQPAAPSLASIGDDYVLGPGDSLVLYLWGDPVDIKELSASYVFSVDRNGNIFFPPAGQIAVWGQNLASVRSLIKGVLDRRYKRLEMNLTLAALRQFPVFVSGYAGNPGTVLVTGADTVLSVLSRAGGIKKTGSLRKVLLNRQGKNAPEKIEIDFYDSLIKGLPVDLRIREGDSVFVPGIGPVAALGGALKRPAIYELKAETDLTAALELAGGRLPSAYSGGLSLLRFSAMGKTLASGDLSDSAFASQKLLDGDYVSFGKTAEALVGEVRISGPVKYSGRYEIASFKTLKALLEKAQALPEMNLFYGRVYRIGAEGADKSFAFSPREVLSGNDIPLAEFDRVVLYRYDEAKIDPDFNRFADTIVLEGEAKPPALYALGSGLKLSALLSRDRLLLNTSLNYAEITRYKDDGKNEYFTFRPADVLAGAWDFDLAARDSIRLVKVGYAPEHPDFDRFSDTLLVKGPLRFGGLYAWRKGMKLSELQALAQPLIETNQVYADIQEFLPGGKASIITFAPREVGEGSFDLELSARSTVRYYARQTEAKAAVAALAVTGTASVESAALPVAEGGRAAAAPAAPAQGEASSGISTDMGFFLEVVYAKGQIRYVGPYARTPNLKLSSVVTPDQILQDTDLDYAELTRRTAEGGWEYRTFSPRAVLSGVFDLDLRAQDAIVFMKAGYLPEKFDFDRFGNAFALTGRVRFAGLYSLDASRPLSEVLKADQLLSDTDIYYAEIDRWVSGGRIEHFTFSPLSILMGSSDIRIFPRDIVRLLPSGDKGEKHDFSRYADTVILKGAIRYPGRYAWFEGFKLSDILVREDLLIDTEIDYAEIRRQSAVEEKILSFSPRDIVEGRAEMPLFPRDIVIFYPKAVNKPVMVSGEVAEAKVIPYYDGMELAAVLRSLSLNGDLATLKAVVSKAGGESVDVYLEEYFKKQASMRLVLTPGDSIAIKRLLPDEHLPVITVRGAVQRPQSLAFRDGMRLSEALEAAGGFGERAYPYGLVLIRKTAAETQQKQVDRLIAQLEAASAAGAALPVAIDSTMSSAAAIIANLQIDLAIQRAKLGALKQLYKEGFGRISLDMPSSLEALKNSSADVVLERDDMVFVPTTPTYVLVSGEVADQKVLAFYEGITVKQAVREAGWLSAEADLSRAYIVRASGRLDSTEGKGFLFFRPNILNYKLRPGDTVVVPTKSSKLNVAWAYTKDAIIVIGTLLTGALTTKTLLGL